MWHIAQHYKPASRWRDQDRIAVEELQTEETLLAVFDGHGASDAVDVAKNTLVASLKCVPRSLILTDLLAAFWRTHVATKYCRGGTVAAVAVLRPCGHALVAILGDSIVLAQPENAKLFVSTHHNVRRNMRERTRVIEAGGHYFSGYVHLDPLGCGLQVARAFGDCELRPILSAAPDIQCVSVRPRGWLAVMSDGVLDISTSTFSKRKKRFAQMVNDGTPLEQIVDCFRPPKNDDASLILAKYQE